MTHPNREGRERAIELLYESEAKGLHPAEVIAGLPIPPLPYATALAEGVGDHLELLDHLIGNRAKGWTVERMASLDRALLRLGTYELAFEPDQPEGIVLSEAVALAKRYSTDESPKFVNGVLAAVNDDVRGGGPWRNVSCPLALLIDMDGVIRHWTGGITQFADDELGLPAGTIAAIALDPERVRRANDGTITDEEWRSEVVAALIREHGCDPEAAASAWVRDGFTFDPEVLDLVRSVKAGGALTACVSNASSRLETDLADHGVDLAFGAVVNSSRLRIMKPAPGIYEAAVEAVGVPAGDCLFVDDRAENVQGALAIGLPAVRFTTAARLDATLRRVGLLPAADGY
jgi:transcription antitermination factor NusB